MPYVPPWLNVQPSDFVSAAQAGAKVGTQLSEIATNAGLTRERIASSERENAARLGAEQQMAGARSAAVAQEEEAQRRMRQWEEGQRIQLAQQQLTSQNERAANALDVTKQYHTGMLSARDVANQIAKQRADQAPVAPGAAASKMTPLDEHMLSDALIRRRGAQTEATKAAESISGGGEVPKGIQDRIDTANEDIDTISKKYMQAASKPGSGLQEGQRVRNRTTGQTGTVVNGEVVPDEEAGPSPDANVPAEPNPYAAYGLPVSRGFFYSGENAEVPAR